MRFSRRLPIPLLSIWAILGVAWRADAAMPVPIRVAAAPPAPGLDLPPVADLNGDAFADLVVLTRRSRNVVLFFGSAGGLPATPSARLPLPGTPRDMALGDFDGNGITDIAVLVTPGTVAVLLGNGVDSGDGTFTAPIVTPAPRASAIAVAALHGPSAPHDLIAVRSGRNDQLLLLASNADGTFSSGDANLGAPTLPRLRITVADVGTSPSDNTRDGLADVLVHGRRPRFDVSSAFLAFGDGAGRLVWGPPVLTFLDLPGPLLLGEQTGDGCNDLIAVGRHRDAAMNRIAGRCNGDALGPFQDHASGIFEEGERITDAISVALDGGLEDEVVLVDESANRISIQPISPRSFLARQVCPVGEKPQSVAAGDFDADGAVDLATANRLGGDVTVLSGPTSVTCGAGSTLEP